MPGGPGLLALSFAPNPTADQLPVVGIAALILRVVEESWSLQMAARRQKTLAANGEVWQMRHTTKQEAGQPYTLCRVNGRKRLVVCEAIDITRQALSNPGDSVVRVDSLAAISRIGASVLRISGKHISQKSMEVQRR